MKWIISHPGTLKKMQFKTFDESVKYFEGFNPPCLKIGKIIEPLCISNLRMEKYMEKRINK